MKMRTTRGLLMFAWLGVLLALSAVVNWRGELRKPLHGSPRESGLAELAPPASPAAHDTEISARVEEFDVEALPQRTLERTLELPESPERSDLLQRAATAWLQSDATAALEWLRGVEDATIKRIVIRQQVDNLLAANDPASAAAWLDRIPDPIDRKAMVSRVSESWGRVQSHVAWQWGTGLPEGEARSIAIQNILSSWAEEHPVEAATAAVNGLGPEEQSQGVLAVLLSWTQRDPAAAASWVGLFPESPLREIATQNVVGNWAVRDVASAGDWLEGLPDGGSREAGFLTWQSLESSFVRESKQ